MAERANTGPHPDPPPVYREREEDGAPTRPNRKSQTANRKSAPGDRQSIVWHGFELLVPEDWNPIKVDGDRDRGFLLLADMTEPKIGLRWRNPGRRRFDADQWARRALVEEVGKLAADEARMFTPKPADAWRGGRIYIEPEPPGRDVFVGQSTVSGRLVELIYHAKRRDRVMEFDVLPTLRDLPLDEPMPWRIFDLACDVPAGWRLLSHRLAAGDLRLTFGRGREWVMVRQVAVAKVALQRLPMERWLGSQLYEAKRFYRAGGSIDPTMLDLRAGRTIEGIIGKAKKRKRYVWQFRRPKGLSAIALHDVARDRLILGQGTDEAALREILATMGGEAADGKLRGGES